MQPPQRVKSMQLLQSKIQVVRLKHSASHWHATLPIANVSLLNVIGVCCHLLVTTGTADYINMRALKSCNTCDANCTRSNLATFIFRWPLITLIRSLSFKYLFCCFYQSLIKQNVKECVHKSPTLTENNQIPIANGEAISVIKK